MVYMYIRMQNRDKSLDNFVFKTKFLTLVEEISGLYRAHVQEPIILCHRNSNILALFACPGYHEWMCKKINPDPINDFKENA